jgi:hypothetical protein
MTSSLKCAVMLTLLLCNTTLTHAQVRQHSDLPQGVSASWWQQVQEHIRKSEYHISKRSDGRYTSPNRAQNLRFVYEPNGFSATRRDSLAHLWRACLTFAGFSKSGASPESQHAHDFTLTADANTLVAQSDAIVIKYCNDEKGMRQDFIVKRKPDGNGDLRLWLYAEMQGGTVSTTAEQISFLTESGAEAMRYSDLKVWDASQKRLKARFEKVGNQVAIVVSDRKAMYPITIDPLSTTPNWTAESNQGNAQFGYSVASAGDVNGDGFSDVIVGAYRFDNGQTDEGAAFVYHGSASGLSTTPDWTAESDQDFAEFGVSVASAGDVNGDGYSDVIVGAYLFDNVETNEGRAFVYHGSASGLSTTPNWTAESNQSFAYFGSSVASAGDVNGDGFSDVIVGAFGFDNGQTFEGAAFVYHGSANGVNNGVLGTPANAAWTAESNQAGARFGSSVASAGDVNGDGYSDVIVGALLFDNPEPDEGRAFVYHGSASGLSTTPNWTAESNQAGARFGSSVASAGDVNGDGYSDVIVGAYLFANGQTDEGAAFVYHGSEDGVNNGVPGTPANAAWTAESNQGNAQFGFSVASAGDVNGDGFSDVIVGAYLFDNPEPNEGRAFVYHGSASGLSTTPNWTAESNQAGAEFGFSVASAGDVNGDGYSDVIVGAYQFDNGETDEGRAFVYHGSASGLSTTPNWTAESNQANAQFGNSVASAGDVNGDGYSDVIVGAPLFDNGQTDEGAAFVYHGSASGLSTTPNWTAESNQAGAQFGSSVASAGDVNGDGYSDVIVGAWEFDNGQTDEGAAFVYHGSANGVNNGVPGTPANAAWTAESNQAGARFGVSVASAGDVNGDGYSDVIVGAWEFDNGQTDEGAAFVYHGSANGVNNGVPGTPANAAWTAESNQNLAWFGVSVASAGDVNGDGFSDVIVGARLFDNPEPNEGAAFVYHGSASGLSTTPNWTAESNQAGAQFGSSVASAGDVNGDGFSDVIVGAYFFDNGQTDEGAAFVYHGSASGLSTTPNWTAESNQANAWFGVSVASAGDVNGDGYSDVIVGAPLFTNGQFNEGAAFVYHGSASGLSTTPNWTAESNQANAFFGISVASAGDVNGDGYSDVIVGAFGFSNGQTFEGAAFVYYGNGGIGLRQDIRQFRPSTTTPIVPALKTTSPNSVTLQKRRQSIAGRSNVKLQFEVKPLGTAFNGTGLTESVFTLHGVGGTPTPLLISGLSNKTLYKWRVRQVERSTGIGYILLPRSRWYYPAGVAPTESHFQVSDDDLPLPVELLSFRGELTLQGVQLTWETASEVNNAGFVLQRRHSGETTYTEIASYLTHPALRGLGTSPMGKIYTYLDASRLNEGESYYYRLQDVDFNGNITEHAEIEVSVVRAYRLMQNYPNPFNPSTVISYQLPVASEVSLKVFDVLGREVAVLVSGRQKAGNYVVPFNGSGLSSGVYFYRLQAGQFVQTRKMMLVK